MRHLPVDERRKRIGISSHGAVENQLFHVKIAILYGIYRLHIWKFHKRRHHRKGIAWVSAYLQVHYSAHIDLSARCDVADTYHLTQHVIRSQVPDIEQCTQGQSVRRQLHLSLSYGKSHE